MASHIFDISQINCTIFRYGQNWEVPLRFVKGGISAILNSNSTKKCNCQLILPTIQVSLGLITTS